MGNCGGQSNETVLVVAICCCSSVVLGLFLFYAYKHQAKFGWLNFLWDMFGLAENADPGADAGAGTGTGVGDVTGGEPIVGDNTGTPIDDTGAEGDTGGAEDGTEYDTGSDTGNGKDTGAKDDKKNKKNKKKDQAGLARPKKAAARKPSAKLPVRPAAALKPSTVKRLPTNLAPPRKKRLSRFEPWRESYAPLSGHAPGLGAGAAPVPWNEW